MVAILSKPACDSVSGRLQAKYHFVWCVRCVDSAALEKGIDIRLAEVRKND